MNIGKIMYTWMNDLLPKSLDNLFSINEEIHDYFTRNARGPHLQRIKTNLMKKSFLIESPKFWLLLPQEIKNSNNCKLFCKRLKRYLKNNVL